MTKPKYIAGTTVLRCRSCLHMRGNVPEPAIGICEAGDPDPFLRRIDAPACECFEPRRKRR